jgi:hypothetical protein
MGDTTFTKRILTLLPLRKIGSTLKKNAAKQRAITRTFYSTKPHTKNKQVRTLYTQLNLHLKYTSPALHCHAVELPQHSSCSVNPGNESSTFLRNVGTQNDTASHPWRLEHRRENLKSDTPPTCLLDGLTFTYQVRRNKHCHLNHKTAWSVYTTSGWNRQNTVFCVHAHFLSTMSYLWSGWGLSIWQLLSIVATSPTPTVCHRTAAIIVRDRPLLKWIHCCEIYMRLPGWK